MDCFRGAKARQHTGLTDEFMIWLHDGSQYAELTLTSLFKVTKGETLT